MAADVETELETQVGFGAAIMTLGQVRTFTVESDTLTNTMIIPVAVWGGTGSLNVRVTKTDTTGEVIAVMQYGVGGHPSFNYITGITPRTIELSTRIWGYGTTTIYSAILFSLEEGPYEYTVRLAYN
jgi:hypothetical protein